MMQAGLNIRLKEDLLSKLTGEIAIAVDGPILPDPAWTVILKVSDANGLQKTIDTLLAAMNAGAQAELLYFTLISLAVLSEQDRQMLYSLCERVRARGGRIAAAGYGRTPPSHCDVLGPCRFDGAVGANGPRGPPRGHFRVSEVRRGDRAAFWWVRSEVHG